MSMDITHLMDEKPNERDPFWFLKTVDGPAETSLGAPPGGAAPVRARLSAGARAVDR
jgi:hypothetical protein